MDKKYRILFVCLGNICRSVTAQSVMQKIIDERGLSDSFEVDSAGILNYHQGELADARMRAHASRRGYKLTHLSRPVITDDFDRFDLILAMDDKNYDDLYERAPSIEDFKKVKKMGAYCRKMVVDYVPDPYYGGEEGFEYVLDILEDSCEGLLDSLSK